MKSMRPAAFLAFILPIIVFLFLAFGWLVNQFYDIAGAIFAALLSVPFLVVSIPSTAIILPFCRNDEVVFKICRLGLVSQVLAGLVVTTIILSARSEQTGTGQPATPPAVGPQGGDKPQPEAEPGSP